MDPRKLGIDDRLRDVCANCHASDPSTKDHNPSKIFIDKPYSHDLPTVPMCRSCNLGFSLDEQYVACLIECAVTGFESIEAIQRPNIRKILQGNKALSLKLQQARSLAADGTAIFSTETERLISVVTKLARGHINYELSNVMSYPPNSVTVVPINTLTEDQKATFIADPNPTLFPEIGSRQFRDLIYAEGVGFYSEGWSDWKIIQPNRYQYVVEQNTVDSVRIFLSDYLCCEVVWN